ncbi:MAG TPA: restriction endonuclease subunit S [Anaerolineae bacterium]|nr:restriction endonuclease subunit S [Anaerolineae bacterium]
MGIANKNKLPSGWTTVNLGKIVNIKYGKGLPTKKLTERGYPVFGANGIIGFYTDYLYEEEQVLISCRGAYSGKINWSPAKCYITNNSLVLETPSEIKDIKKYLFYALQSADKSKIVTGSAQPQVTINNVIDLIIPLAPHYEQKLIVAEIEKQFSRLDEAVENLKRVKANLKRYKASVLKAAVEGTLINTITENTSFFVENWQPIESALVTLDQGWSPKCDRLQANGPEWGVIKTSAVQALQYIEWENKRLPESIEPRRHLELQKNDLLVTRAGPRKRVGVCCLVRSTRSKLILCDKVYRLRCNHEVALPGYLELVLNAPQIKESINELKTGISDSGVNLTQKRFKALRIPLPSVELQIQIESEVQRLWSIADSATLSTTEGSARCQRLRQSILKKAFSGQL